jgi:PleD family two-component response regulator
MAGPLQRRSILTVDDDEMERSLQREVLEPAGFGIIEAGSGTAALQLYASHRPDLVMLDVMMPEMNGFDVCQAIRALPGGRNIPILMATALDDTDSIDQAYRVGATDFIGKPINWPVLPHRVRYMLRAHETLKNLILSQQRLAEAQRIAGLGYRRLPHEIRHIAERMIERHGSDAPRRAVDQLNARIEACDMQGRDHWAQVVHAIHAEISKLP